LAITADAGFGVATSVGGTYVSTLNFTPNGSNAVPQTTIYIKANDGSASGTTVNVTCSSTGQTSKVVAGTVTKYALPVFSVNPTASAQSFCAGSTATPLSVYFTPGSGNDSYYSWYSNSSNSNTGGTPVINATTIAGSSVLSETYTPSTNTAGSSYYYAVVTNSYGCKAASTVSGLVTINPRPTVVTTPINLCYGLKANLTIDSVTAGSSPNLTFVYASLQTFTTNSIVADPTKVNSGSYYIKGTDNNGCSSSAVLVRVNTKSSPSVQKAIVVDNVCYDDNKGSITLTMSNTGTEPFSFSWTKVDDNTFNSTSKNLSGLTVGTYNLGIIDAFGCTSQSSTFVSAVDGINPAIPILPDIKAECSVTVNAPTTTDNCDGILTGTQANYSSLYFDQQGTYIIDWTFTDYSGNQSFASQNVIIKDKTAPLAPTLSDLSGECSVTASAPTAEDNCTGTITASTEDPTTYNAPGEYTITWNFDDGNGNVSHATQKVIVTDNNAPVAPVLEDIVVECAVDFTITAPTAEDACSGIVSGTTDDPLVYSTQGTHVVNWAFDDGHGNVSYATQNIIVKDITAPDVPVLSDLADQCSVTATAPTTTDNCVGLVTGKTSDPLTYSAQGTYTIHWTFSDGHGNSSTFDCARFVRGCARRGADGLALRR
jgi:hypothetical protein